MKQIISNPTVTTTNTHNSPSPPTVTYTDLSSEINTFYYQTRPDHKDIEQKEKLLKYIKHCVGYIQHQYIREAKQPKKKFKKFNFTKKRFLENMTTRKMYTSNWKVFRFGSSSWGTDIGEDSDIDLAIALNFRNNRPDKTFILNRLSQIISENDKNGELRVQILCNASYPVIKVSHIYHKCCKIDISIADRFCHKRNALMVEYMDYYENICHIPIKKLIIFVKHWSKQRGINNAYYGYLNSFGYALMIMAFIQGYKGEDISLQTLCEKFFEYYAFKYDALQDCIDIKNGKNGFSKRKCRMIEDGNGNCVMPMMEIMDPINKVNNVAKSVGYYQFNNIRSEFVRAYQTIAFNKEGLFDLLTEDRFANNNDSHSNNTSDIDTIDATETESSSVIDDSQSESVSD